MNMMCLKHPLTVPSTCQSLPGMKLSRKPKWGKKKEKKENPHEWVVKSECESWLHCSALGKGSLHSVPEFPRVYKTNPSNFIQHLLCAKVFYSRLVPRPALRRLELSWRHHPHLQTDSGGLTRARDLSHNCLVRAMPPGPAVGLVSRGA